MKTVKKTPAAVKRATLPQSIEDLRKVFAYDPITGIVTRRKSGKKAGSVAGKGHRHLQVCHKGVRVYVHHLVWALQTGTWVADDLDIDHKDGNGQNNAWDNLRKATRAQNMANAKLSAANTSGYKGVGAYKGRFRAYCQTNNVFHHLGYFDTAEDAARAYDAKAVDLFGSFAKTNFPVEVAKTTEAAWAAVAKPIRAPKPAVLTPAAAIAALKKAAQSARKGLL